MTEKIPITPDRPSGILVPCQGCDSPLYTWAVFCGKDLCENCYKIHRDACEYCGAQPFPKYKVAKPTRRPREEGDEGRRTRRR
jgi:hypothetical protein